MADTARTCAICGGNLSAGSDNCAACASHDSLALAPLTWPGQTNSVEVSIAPQSEKPDSLLPDADRSRRLTWRQGDAASSAPTDPIGDVSARDHSTVRAAESTLQWPTKSRGETAAKVPAPELVPPKIVESVPAVKPPHPHRVPDHQHNASATPSLEPPRPPKRPPPLPVPPPLPPRRTPPPLPAREPYRASRGEYGHGRERSEFDRPYGSVMSGMLWMIGLTFLLFWMPLLGPFLAGIVGGRKSGGVLNAVMAALLPSLMMALFLVSIAATLSGIPIIGSIASAGALVVAFAGFTPLLVGAILGGAFSPPGEEPSGIAIVVVLALSALVGFRIVSQISRDASTVAGWLS